MKRLSDKRWLAVALSVVVIAIIAFVAVMLASGAWLIKSTQPDTNKDQKASKTLEKSDTIHDNQLQKATKDQAAKTATAKFGGSVKSVEDDTHNGRATWEVELRDSREGRIEVEVDKQSGEIVHWEQD